MNDIEDDLKAALCRKPAPPGFAAKVFERMEDGSASSKARWKVSNPFWMAAAAVILMMVGSGVVGYRHHVRTRNEAALNRTLAALSIAAAQLDEAEKRAFPQERWERIGKQLSEVQSSEGK